MQQGQLASRTRTRGGRCLGHRYIPARKLRQSRHSSGPGWAWVGSGGVLRTLLCACGRHEQEIVGAHRGMVQCWLKSKLQRPRLDTAYFKNVASLPRTSSSSWRTNCARFAVDVDFSLASRSITPPRTISASRLPCKQSNDDCSSLLITQLPSMCAFTRMRRLCHERGATQC